MRPRGPLTVVSNRLPITIESTADGDRLHPSCGGLVSALLPILRESGGYWVGWAGTDHEERLEGLLADCCAEENYSFAPVFLTAGERAEYYRGFSNEIIWPLFHCLPSRCQFGSAYWDAYRNVNRKFAQAVTRLPSKGDFVWVHDYHLMILAQALRSLGSTQRVGYFHHIPFPPPDVFEMLPWRVEVLRALMQFDLLGFQTQRDRRNFIACLNHCLSNVRVGRLGETFAVCAEDRTANVGVYPISVDYEWFTAQAAQPPIAEFAAGIRASLAGSRIILGIDRLDYTKGILERLIAFRAFLRRNPDLCGRATMIQIVVPSREDIPEYAQLRLRIETLISQINGEYGRPSWAPIHYFHRCVSQPELIAFYRAAHVALVTPLKDGMNLVAKEFCASRVDNSGVLILSEFAGAADELKLGALLVNPHSADQVATALENAFRMDEAEERSRMQKMRSCIQLRDVFHWSRAYTTTLVSGSRGAQFRRTENVSALAR